MYTTLKKLRALAERATRGPWVPERHKGPVCNGWFDALPPGATPIESRGTQFALGVAVAGAAEKHDAEFIAALDPQTVLSILDRLEDAEAQRDALKKQLPETMQGCTIRFRSCDLGHGWLTATNWVDHGCPTCALKAAQAEAAEGMKAAGTVGALASQVRTLEAEVEKLRQQRDDRRCAVTGLPEGQDQGPCSGCLKHKPLPYRRDDLGGYVCLTCVEKYLNETLAALQALKLQGLTDKYVKGVDEYALKLADMRTEQVQIVTADLAGSLASWLTHAFKAKFHGRPDTPELRAQIRLWKDSLLEQARMLLS